MDNNRMKWITVLLVPLLWSCGTVKYVPVETVRTETQWSEAVSAERDSVFLHDSVFVAVKGDTVTIEKFRYLYRDKVVRDTIKENQIVCEIREVPVVVEREYTRWENFRLRAFWWLVGLSLAGGVWIFRKRLAVLLKKLL